MRHLDTAHGQEAEAAQAALSKLEAYTLTLGRDVMTARARPKG